MINPLLLLLQLLASLICAFTIREMLVLGFRDKIDEHFTLLAASTGWRWYYRKLGSCMYCQALWITLFVFVAIQTPYLNWLVYGLAAGRTLFHFDPDPRKRDDDARSRPTARTTASSEKHAPLPGGADGAQPAG